MWRKIIFACALIPVICIGTFLFCQPAYAEQQEIVAAGSCGESVEWSLDAEGTLTISGTGSMDSYSGNNPAPWYDYRLSITNAVVGDGVTNIGTEAFKSCRNLVHIQIPDSVQKFGSQAFYQCSSLEEIHIPDGVAEITPGMLSRCNSLTEVHLPESVTRIYDYAFWESGNIVHLNIPSDVTYIGEEAFKDCHKWTGEIVIPSGVTSIKPGTFIDCYKITSFTIHDGVTSIGDNAFWGCNITSIDIPDSVTSIGKAAFQCCNELTTIRLPSGITRIEDKMFEDCYSLKNIVIPDGVTSIGVSAFNSCRSLKEIIIPDKVTVIEAKAFSECDGLESITIPSGVTTIESGTFYGCTNLAQIEIPQTVTTIGNYAFYGCTGLVNIYIPAHVTSVGSNAFSHCSNIASITVAPNHSVYHASGNCLIHTSNRVLVLGCKNSVIPSDNSVVTIGNTAFEGCTGLTGIAIPDNITKISDSAFRECTNLGFAVIGDGVASIEDNAFRRCISLEYIVLPETVQMIAHDAFALNFFDAGFGNKDISVWHVFYKGTKAQRDQIIVTDGDNVCNQKILAATTWHYSCTGEELVNGVCRICCTHQWKLVSVNKEPTCTERGEANYRCSLCEMTKTDIIDVLDHSWDSGVTNADATITYTCIHCSETKTEASPITPTEPTGTPPTAPVESPEDPTEATTDSPDPSDTMPSIETTIPSESIDPTHPSSDAGASLDDLPAPTEPKPEYTSVVIILFCGVAGTYLVFVILRKNKLKHSTKAHKPEG